MSEIDKFLWEYGSDVLRTTSVQTHTDWERYFKKSVTKYKPILKKLTRKMPNEQQIRHQLLTEIREKVEGLAKKASEESGFLIDDTFKEHFRPRYLDVLDLLNEMEEK